MSLHEIETHWSLTDVYEAHSVLAEIARVEKRAHERAARGTP